jgi:eukaryotic-like serine/threonine-protein kinase
VTARRVVAGRYRLEERIGSGAMGVVWRGTDERLGRVVAVKQVFLHGGLDRTEAEEVRQRTLREGRIAARLQHPHAISVFDASIEGDEPWLVMEYLPSRSLAAVLGEQGTLEPRLVARIGRQVADALDAAHQAGIVHRDVKPGNVLIGADGTVKITDFGISRATGDLTLTRTGMLAGTPAYLAPEVARGEDSTAASDVFSLGATLYAAVEGIPPFGAEDNALALLHTVAAGAVIPPTQAGPLTALLMRLLRSEPQDRPTAAEARQALGRIAHSPGSRNGHGPDGRSTDQGSGDDGLLGFGTATGAHDAVRPAPAPTRVGFAGATEPWADEDGGAGSTGGGRGRRNGRRSGWGLGRARTPAAADDAPAPDPEPSAAPGPAPDDRATDDEGGGPAVAAAALRAPAGPDARPRPSARPQPATRGRPGRRPTRAVAIAVVVLALVAGAVVGAVVLGGGSDSGTTGASLGTPTAAAPVPGDANAQMVAAVRDYYSVVTGNNGAGWARLGPGMQSSAGGFGAYQGFWSTIASARVDEAEAVDDETVRATVVFTPRNRASSTEVHQLGMIRGADGSWLINSDRQVR